MTDVDCLQLFRSLLEQEMGISMEAYKPLIKVRALHAVLPIQDLRHVMTSCNSS